VSRSSRHRANRVLHPVPIESATRYLACGGGAGMRAAAALAPQQVIDVVRRSGLRGRGGAGFPVGRKWATVAEESARTGLTPTVVVNGAEGEPGTFKDRSIIRSNPYQVVEGAYIAAYALGASRVVIATKRSFTTEVSRLRRAAEELQSTSLGGPNVAIEVFEGPDEYLYGEESALLETIDGRQPFPRVTPTYRVGLCGRMHDDPDASAAGPSVVNNVESIANVPKILARGPEWFRRLGTSESPGTTVCTVTGDTVRHSVGEVRFGTPLRHVLRSLGGGARPGRSIKAVLSGVANPVILRDQLRTRVSYEAMAAIGSGPGSGGFIVFDDTADMVAVAAGVARFLSVESCGQCTPCKIDGMNLAALLADLALNRLRPTDLDVIARRIGTVSYGARCYLGIQQEVVLRSLLDAFRDEFEAHAARTAPARPPVLIAELVDIVDERAHLDESFLHKQPDWSFAETYSGAVPVDLCRDRRKRV
jgi:NADH-quinone oxidoreductase subunit F